MISQFESLAMRPRLLYCGIIIITLIYTINILTLLCNRNDIHSAPFSRCRSSSMDHAEAGRCKHANSTAMPCSQLLNRIQQHEEICAANGCFNMDAQKLPKFCLACYSLQRFRIKSHGINRNERAPSLCAPCFSPSHLWLLRWSNGCFTGQTEIAANLYLFLYIQINSLRHGR